MFELFMFRLANNYECTSSTYNVAYVYMCQGSGFVASPLGIPPDGLPQRVEYACHACVCMHMHSHA